MSAAHYAVAARTVALGLNGVGLVPQELNRDQSDADRYRNRAATRVSMRARCITPALARS